LLLNKHLEDIGRFDSQHLQTVGREILIKGEYLVSPKEVDTIISQLKGKKDA
jgi:folylpolyglutamate synthase/dihydropteroate synthase